MRAVLYSETTCRPIEERRLGIDRDAPVGTVGAVVAAASPSLSPFPRHVPRPPPPQPLQSAFANDVAPAGLDCSMCTTPLNVYGAIARLPVLFTCQHCCQYCYRCQSRCQFRRQSRSQARCQCRCHVPASPCQSQSHLASVSLPIPDASPPARPESSPGASAVPATDAQAPLTGARTPYSSLAHTT